jgi:hypothetical protein
MKHVLLFRFDFRARRKLHRRLEQRLHATPEFRSVDAPRARQNRLRSLSVNGRRGAIEQHSV